MCGIVGYIGSKAIKTLLLEGLRELEYRGYDSAGIAIIQEKLTHFKAVGKLANLEQLCADFETSGFGIGIGHTRWATHGKPTVSNAHPHLGAFSYVVHNGIIENYQELKSTLVAQGVTFASQTDTEVIVHLFEHHLHALGDAHAAFATTVAQIKGAFAILLITQSAPDTIFFAKVASPLLVGFGANHDELFFASSDAALIGLAQHVLYLEDGDYGYAKEGQLFFQNSGSHDRKSAPLVCDRVCAQKGGFRYFMEKEIYEQSEVLHEAMMGRVVGEGVHFEELDASFLADIETIRICACGTSYHAALAATYLFERKARIRCYAEIASEFRYKEPILDPQTLFIVISQSGETADTLEALKMASQAGLKTLAICNVDNASIVRHADRTILTRAGIEKGVASTKAFATQVMVLWMLALYLGRQKAQVSQEFLASEVAAMRKIPALLQCDPTLHQQLKKLSKRYLHGHGFFFVGRDIFYPLALEGALKLKEISYLHAEGYPAGEMKHGPIALVDSTLFTIAFVPKTILFEKIKSNVEELSARDATILVIGPERIDAADDFVRTKPASHPMEEFFEMMLISQLLALEIAIRLGNDVDMPRNLAKSVTVE